jgi:hypothetical protein
MKKYIKSKQASSFRRWGLFIHKTPVVIKDSCEEKDRVEKVVFLAKSKIPPHLMDGVEGVFFGKFAFFEEDGILSRCLEKKILFTRLLTQMKRNICSIWMMQL